MTPVANDDNSYYNGGGIDPQNEVSNLSPQSPVSSEEP